MSNKPINWFRFASPQAFYPLAGKMIPWFWALAAIFGIAGLYVGFLVAPTDAQQGEGYRIIFLHVPASWMSMFIYLVMAFWAGLGLAFNFRLSGMMATALAPSGALFAFLSLWTGALWGKPMWGSWWVWDARLTSELILLFLYVGFIALQSAIDDARKEKAAEKQQVRQEVVKQQHQQTAFERLQVACSKVHNNDEVKAACKEMIDAAGEMAPSTGAPAR